MQSLLRLASRVFCCMCPLKVPEVLDSAGSSFSVLDSDGKPFSPARLFVHQCARVQRRPTYKIQ